MFKRKINYDDGCSEERKIILMNKKDSCSMGGAVLKCFPIIDNVANR